MILPIVAYGHPVLRKVTREISSTEPGIQSLIEDMFETMYHAHGVGLAAPQVGKDLRIFVADASPMEGTLDDEEMPLKGWKKVFINPVILEEEGEEWAYEEGCLSIPDIRADVWRQPRLVLKYQDENFEPHTETFSGMRARIIQHEYDHLEGILFVDKISPLKRQLLRSRLSKISKGQVELRYPMTFQKLVR